MVVYIAKGGVNLSVSSVKIPKTLSKHISLNIGERDEKKEENQV